MSSIFTLDLRERWSVRSMLLRRWHIHRWFDPKAGPLCDIEVDGVTRPVHYWHYGRRLREADYGSIFHFYVAEGNEIGPYAELFEYGDGANQPEDLRRAPLHSLAKLRLTRRERYPRIFINYRKDDADAYAGRLHEVLAQEFGEDEVFFAEFSINAGEVWDWTVQQAVVHADVVLALVGSRWLTVKTDEKRRIDLPRDMVRREIVAGLDRGTPVIPVLLPEATVPRDFVWNDELHMLPQLQFHRLSGARHWKADVADLIATIRLQLSKTQALDGSC